VDCSLEEVKPADCSHVEVYLADCSLEDVQPADCSLVEVYLVDCSLEEMQPVDCSLEEVPSAEGGGLTDLCQHQSSIERAKAGPALIADDQCYFKTGRIHYYSL
jgi:hypothetical protein